VSYLFGGTFAGPEIKGGRALPNKWKGEASWRKEGSDEEMLKPQQALG